MQHRQHSTCCHFHARLTEPNKLNGVVDAVCTATRGLIKINDTHVKVTTAETRPHRSRASESISPCGRQHYTRRGRSRQKGSARGRGKGSGGGTGYHGIPYHTRHRHRPTHRHMYTHMRTAHGTCRALNGTCNWSLHRHGNSEHPWHQSPAAPNWLNQQHALNYVSPMQCQMYQCHFHTIPSVCLKM